MEKGECAHFEQFHLFPQCFPKAYFFDALKKSIDKEKGFKTKMMYTQNNVYLTDIWVYMYIYLVTDLSDLLNELPHPGGSVVKASDS